MQCRASTDWAFIHRTKGGGALKVAHRWEKCIHALHIADSLFPQEVARTVVASWKLSRVLQGLWLLDAVKKKASFISIDVDCSLLYSRERRGIFPFLFCSYRPSPFITTERNKKLQEFYRLSLLLPRIKTVNAFYRRRLYLSRGVYAKFTQIPQIRESIVFVDSYLLPRRERMLCESLKTLDCSFIEVRVVYDGFYENSTPCTYFTLVPLQKWREFI